MPVEYILVEPRSNAKPCQRTATLSGKYSHHLTTCNALQLTRHSAEKILKVKVTTLKPDVQPR